MGILDRVVLRTSVALDTRLLGELAENGAGVFSLSGRGGRKLAVLLPDFDSC